MTMAPIYTGANPPRLLKKGNNQPVFTADLTGNFTYRSASENAVWLYPYIRVLHTGGPSVKGQEPSLSGVCSGKCGWIGRGSIIG